MYEVKLEGDNKAVRTLLIKLANVTKSLDSIPKNGDNKDYKYVMESDVVMVIRTKLTENNLVMIPSVVESSNREVEIDGRKSSIIKVVMSFTFYDTETGASITTYSQGEGEDVLDKGIYKAITGSQKYALLKTFLIPTYDDPEAVAHVPVDINATGRTQETYKGNKQDKTISKKQANEIFYMVKGKQAELLSILSKYGYKTTYQIKESDAESIKADIKKIS